MNAIIIAFLAFCRASPVDSTIIDLTNKGVFCGDFLRVSNITAEHLNVDYEPLRATHLRERVTLSQGDIAFIDNQIVFLQRMEGKTVTSKKFRRSIQESDSHTVDHILIPYNSPNMIGYINFIVPFINTPSTDCFKWPDLIARANNTSKGILAFATENKERTFYYIGEAILCNRNAIVSALGYVKTNTRFVNVSSTVYPINTNCQTYGIGSETVFNNGIGQNCYFWIFFVTILFFALYAAIADSEVLIKPTADKNIFTHHPLYSLYSAGSEHYLRSGRLMILSAGWSIILLLHAVIAFKIPQIGFAFQVIVISPIAILISFPFEWAVGYLLTRAHSIHSTLVDRLSSAETADERQQLQEDWQCKSYRAYFLFYTFVGLLSICIMALSVFIMHKAVNAVQPNIVIGAVTSLALLFGVREGLILLAVRKEPKIESLFRTRGYWFDSETAIAMENYRLR